MVKAFLELVDEVHSVSQEHLQIPSQSPTCSLAIDPQSTQEDVASRKPKLKPKISWNVENSGRLRARYTRCVDAK